MSNTKQARVQYGLTKKCTYKESLHRIVNTLKFNNVLCVCPSVCVFKYKQSVGSLLVRGIAICVYQGNKVFILI